ncbi:hypothetical protein [Wohlfahrtiimonas chitiniclastica]|uniref:hypothetical protein n=1 Tax=Wohlfahrtiimonas chitiniclastica TaxID=400946 RepID=UPI001BCC6418|nr:hypothetical protein [Wohlfahrtiimonas chitiniclastica]MBS7837170.1 hypothetical protein [Wohlfahrtiimonas chitiniclastica]
MSKFKNIIIIILGAISTFFYVLLKSKDRKIEQQEQQLKSKDQQIKTQEFINEENDKTIVNKGNASNMSDNAIAGVYKQNGWIDD